MITFYCPNCWREVNEADEICSNCGYSIKEFEKLDFIEKCIKALEHPISEIRIFAAEVLGNVHADKSLPMLAKQLESTDDIYFQKAIIESLTKIKAYGLTNLVKKYTDKEKPLIIRMAAENFLKENTKF